MEDLDDDDDFTDAELFDISDVEFEFSARKAKNVVVLTARSESDFNLIRYYLALKQFVEQIEMEIGVSPEHETPQ